MDLRDDLIAYEAIVNLGNAPCQCALSSWTLSPEQLLQWAEPKHIRLVEFLPTIREAIAQWLPTNVYAGRQMPVDAQTLVEGIEIEHINYFHNEDPRYRHPDGTTITIMSNLHKNIDVGRDESFLGMVDVMVTLDENLNIKKICCDG
jgi:hypothetical protein